MALTGAADLLTYLLAAGEREARTVPARRGAMTVNAMPPCRPRNWQG
ncbi:hypothetical protein KDH_00150 [Dictyobacter sp. S3.2.2.5]|uniref:Uncharacterized protein n=1 Tax=Dictyobacter halimunensis TaxID=3026934 RepID=A0ABQ6FLA3_9CHLR|nr:hypothetical protein KDH_00150 [Dictyobacter sp. S3.2.2.5]